MRRAFADLLRQPPHVQFLILALLCWPVPVMSYFSDVRIVAWPVNARGEPAFVDFANLWLGARAALSGTYATLFETTRHQAEIVRVFGVTHTNAAWSYPPTAMATLAPLGLLAFPYAVMLWTSLGLASYIGALRFQSGHLWTSSKLHAVLGAIAFVPGVFLALSYGQTALLTSAALFFGVTQARTRPVVAGAMLGLLVVKPQIGLMVPAALIGLGAWRAFISTPAFAALYLVATVAMFGWEPWQLFVSETMPQQMAFLTEGGVGVTMQMSPFFTLRGMGFGYRAAMSLQWIISLAAAISLMLAFRRERDVVMQFLLFALATLVSIPYLQTYELALLALALGRVVSSPVAVKSLGDVPLTSLIAASTVGVMLTTTVVTRSGVNVTPVLLFGWYAWLAARATTGRAVVTRSAPFPVAGPIAP